MRYLKSSHVQCFSRKGLTLSGPGVFLVLTLCRCRATTSSVTTISSRGRLHIGVRWGGSSVAILLLKWAAMRSALAWFVTTRSLAAVLRGGTVLGDSTLQLLHHLPSLFGVSLFAGKLPPQSFFQPFPCSFYSLDHFFARGVVQGIISSSGTALLVGPGTVFSFCCLVTTKTKPRLVTRLSSVCSVRNMLSLDRAHRKQYCGQSC